MRKITLATLSAALLGLPVAAMAHTSPPPTPNISPATNRDYQAVHRLNHYVRPVSASSKRLNACKTDACRKVRGKKLANVVGDSFVDTSFLPGYADTPCVKRYLFRSHLWLGLMSEVAGAAQTGVKFTPAVQRAHDARVQATFSYAICPAAKKIGR